MPTAGQRLKAQDFTASQFDSDETLQTNISETLHAGTPEVSVVVTAPTSGKVLIGLGLSAQDDSNFGGARLDIEIYEGTDDTGTQIYAGGTIAYFVQTKGQQSTVDLTVSKMSIYEGLTPGENYFIRTLQRGLSTTTADITARSLMAIPLPA